MRDAGQRVSFQSLQEYPKHDKPAVSRLIDGGFQSLQEYPKLRMPRFDTTYIFTVSNPYRNILSEDFRCLLRRWNYVSNPYRNILSGKDFFIAYHFTWFPILTGIS